MANELVYIVGGGIAGLTAGIYLVRAGGYHPILFEKTSPGGLAILAGRIENYPGFPGGIDGVELISRTVEQLKSLGGEIRTEEIKSIRKDEEYFILLGNDEYRTKGFILSTGTVPRRLGIPGEEEFVGRGVSYCGVCDAPFYRDKIVAVIGGGNTALQEAIHITAFAKHIYVIHRRTYFRAFESVVQNAKKNPKIEFVLNAVPTKIIGRDKVEALEIEYLESRERIELEVDGVFIFAGWMPNTGMIQFECEKDKDGFIITDANGMSSVRGMFVAGDVRSKELRQIITAAADGAISAIALQKFLSNEI